MKQDGTDRKRPAARRRSSPPSEPAAPRPASSRARPGGPRPSPTPAATDRPAIGLRELKKARTRMAIQEHALRLIGEQGYAATTVEQIAAAAEVSPSTFFRYFPTKEDVVLYDATDPQLFAAFSVQPAELSVLEATRRAMHEVFEGLSESERQAQQERADMIFSIPELRARYMDEYMGGIVQFSEVLAARVGRAPDDFAVRTFVGAFIGAMLAAYLTARDESQTDFVGLVDDALKQFETGWPF